MTIIINNLHCVYNSGLPTEFSALNGVSFTAERGRILSIVGRTGSGKSTLAQHMNGLIVPRSGEVSVDGMKVSSDKAVLRDIRRSVGLVFQYPEQQIFAETVHDEVAFGPTNWGFPAEEIDSLVQEALKSVGFDISMLYSNPLALSGGQKRRVALASVLASRPSYLVLDEPTAGLDASGIDELTGILADRRAAGVGIVHITHDIDIALEISDYILVLDSGRVMFFGTPEEAGERICSSGFSGLEVPPILKLSWELKKLGRTAKLTNDPTELAAMVGAAI